MYFEVKNLATRYGKKGLNGKQAQEANGLPVALVTDIDGALRALTVLRGPV